MLMHEARIIQPRAESGVSFELQTIRQINCVCRNVVNSGRTVDFVQKAELISISDEVTAL